MWRGRSKAVGGTTFWTRWEVLHWLGEGKSNNEIGQILGIAVKTVNKHLERIYPKLGVDNRTAAANVATELRFAGIA
jgi:DNA-binding CsgD family transcriptional regulator